MLPTVTHVRHGNKVTALVPVLRTDYFASNNLAKKQVRKLNKILGDGRVRALTFVNERHARMALKRLHMHALSHISHSE